MALKRFAGVCAVALAVAMVLVPAAAMAQKEETVTEGGVVYKQKTIYDFEDDTIDGNLTKPDGEYLEVRKRARHQNLIRIREDFNERVIQTVKAL